MALTNTSSLVYAVANDVELPTEDIVTDSHLSHNAANPLEGVTTSLDPVQHFEDLEAAASAKASGTPGIQASPGGSPARGHRDPHQGSEAMKLMIRSVPHLYMLPQADVELLAAAVLKREYAALNIVLESGAKVEHVYLVLQGDVDTFTGTQGKERVGNVPCANIFCLPCIIFDTNARFTYKVGRERTTLGLIPGDVFLEVMKRNVPMAQSIGRKMAERMDVFIVFKEFCRHVFSHETSTQEYLPIWQILESYRRASNCIHSKMHSSELDTGAWFYASRRLPDSATSTFCFELTRALPPFLAGRMKDLARDGEAAGHKRSGRGDIRYVPTHDRRRCSWNLGMEGKTLVLLRDGFTDILDFICCLCIHIIESQKLRARLQGMVDPPAIDILDAQLHCTEDRCLNPESVMAKLPLSPQEQKGLIKIWGPDKVLQKVYDVLMHREEVMLRVDTSISKRFQTDPFHEWALGIRSEVMKTLGLRTNSPLPKDLVIDILSSNTHSTKNCLSSFPRKHRKKILEWGREHKKDVCKLTWENEEDLVYFLSVSYMNAFPDLKEDFQQCLMDVGMSVMEDTALTGLKVDVVPLWKVDLSQIDPAINVHGNKKSAKEHGHFLLNMDFAFGTQADGITKALVNTFGHHIKSFSIMGKAGGLVGKRGDVQLASHVLFSKSSLIMDDTLDELRPCGNQDFTKDRLREILPQAHELHCGPVLTIPGTMLQNEQLLKFYKAIWGCVGVEMEGSYFSRQLREAWKAGLLAENVRTRFAYYTSDLPLPPPVQAGSPEATSLSAPMLPNEGVPPLYAITRLVLECVLRDDQKIGNGAN